MAKSQKRLKRSANNLSQLEGGRHAGEVAVPDMSLDAQRTYVNDLLRRWIAQYV